MDLEMPVIDNEFISLFIPDSTGFKSEDVLEEFKIYIFKISNLTIDSLIQEQVE
jgi:hypothetical protein